MNSLRQKLQQIARAMEFANIDRLDELQSLLEMRQPASPDSRDGTAARRPVAIRRDFGDERIIDFCAFAGRTGLTPSGRGN